MYATIEACGCEQACYEMDEYILEANSLLISSLALNGVSLIDIGSLARAVATFYSVPTDSFCNIDAGYSSKQ